MTAPRMRALSTALRRLDRLMAAAVRAARELERDARPDPYRGLYVSDREVDRLLQREPGAPRLWIGDNQSRTEAGAVEAGAATEPVEAAGRATGPVEADDAVTEPAGSAVGRATDSARSAADPATSADPMRRLQRLFGLSDFELDAIVVALAVEIDLKYQRLFAWLQDDATRRRPTVGLVLDVLCRTATARIDRLRAFADDAPLLARGLIQLVAEEGAATPRLACSLRLDEAVVRHLLGQPSADARLARFCTWHAPALSLARLPLSPALIGRLAGLARNARRGAAPIALQLRGPAGAGQRQIAESLASALGTPLAIADLRRAPRDEAGEGALRLLALEAALRGAVVFVEAHEAEWARGVAGLVAGPAHVVVAASPNDPRPAAPALAIELGEPDALARRAWWASRLGAAGIAGAVDVDALAGRFRLGFDAIAEAVDAAADRRAGTEELMAHARAVSSRSLDALAQAIEPVRSFDDLVLPAESAAQLRELCDRVARRARVLDRWGFARKLSAGTGTNVLFSGPPGTGKTMAAEVVAHALGLKLYRIDLATVVSKYVGETEKNLARIFESAERSNAVLLFDEADALFGKRSAVRDAHDRYANIEISYLLQRMEQYEGVAILATNLAHNMDDAFVRRLAFSISFPFPGEELRRPLWARAWPRETPLGADLDPAWLARRFKLSGGNIKNVALAAAHLVGDDEAEVTLDHVLRAVRREFQKMGKALSDAELGRAPRPAALEVAS
jgi:SpoVK/Ycf46/Vps4 family AAA+-type ATPase